MPTASTVCTRRQTQRQRELSSPRNWGRATAWLVHFRTVKDVDHNRSLIMRRTVLALALLAAVSACSLFRKAKLTDSTPAHTPAQNSTPFGEWVLFTDPNQTAFAGARRVEL